MEKFIEQDLTGAEFRECVMSKTRLIGVVMDDAEIDGLVSNLVVNGVEVSGYVAAELDRRHPVRVLIRSDDPAELREAWGMLRADWATTLALLAAMPPGSEHRRVDDEWSTVETLRHLVFVHDSWFRRCVLGSTAPFTAMGLGPDYVFDEGEQGLDRSAEPSLADVLAVRGEQAAEIEAWLATVSAADLQEPAPVPEGPGWPPYARGRTVAQCLRVVLNEEHEHRGFAVRDLGRMASPASDQQPPPTG
jgi:hypothetical protein